MRRVMEVKPSGEYKRRPGEEGHFLLGGVYYLKLIFGEK